MQSFRLLAWLVLAASTLDTAGFRQSDDIKLFSDRYFLVFSKR